MRVAENAFNTHASNKKVKIATPYGQKTAQAPSKPPLQLLPRRPVTRSMKRGNFYFLLVIKSYYPSTPQHELVSKFGL
jgi:hypothetical protein